AAYGTLLRVEPKNRDAIHFVSSLLGGRLRLPRARLRADPLQRVPRLGRGDDRIPVEDGPRPVAGDVHGRALADARHHEIAGDGAAQVVKSSRVGGPGLVVRARVLKREPG